MRHARTTVPYYRDTGRLDVLFTTDDRIDWGRWDQVAILTRSEAQANSAAVFAESMPADCGEIRSHYRLGPHQFSKTVESCIRGNTTSRIKPDVIKTENTSSYNLGSPPP